MQGTYTVKINMGNEAMENYEQLAAALRKVADKLDRGHVEGLVFDDNGNRVGTFDFEEDGQ